MKQRRPKARWTNYTKPTIPVVDPARIARGDWIRCRSSGTWLKVDALRRDALGRIFAIGADVYGTAVRVHLDDCTPCWNPRTLWYGHLPRPS